MKNRIKDLKPEDRPREKLLTRGPNSLSDHELIAILLNTGIKDKSAIELAKELLDESGSLRNLVRMTSEEIKLKFKGIADAKVAKLMAAFELAIRLTVEISDIKQIKCGKQVFEYYKRLSFENVEKFFILILNSSNRVKKSIEISSGNLNLNVVTPREVFKAAIDNRAASIILVHNHPSGNTQPSESDKNLTETLIKSGEIMGITVLDHVIIGMDNYFSFAENNLIK